MNHGNRGYGERSGFQRQGIGSSSRTFEDKALYFPSLASIGRNYDEDERKPVDLQEEMSHLRTVYMKCEDQIMRNQQSDMFQKAGQSICTHPLI